LGRHFKEVKGGDETKIGAGKWKMETEGQWARVWRKTEASNGELRPNVQRTVGVSVLGGWLNGLSIGPGPKRKLSISSCSGAVEGERGSE